MEKYGFAEMIRAYSKKTGTMEYFLEEVPEDYQEFFSLEEAYEF